MTGKEKKQTNNNLLELRPDIAKQWDYKMNKPLRPEDVSVSCHKKVWWRCEKNHSWQAVISSRTRGNRMPCMFKQKNNSRI